VLVHLKEEESYPVVRRACFNGAFFGEGVWFDVSLLDFCASCRYLLQKAFMSRSSKVALALCGFLFLLAVFIQHSERVALRSARQQVKFSAGSRERFNQTAFKIASSMFLSDKHLSECTGIFVDLGANRGDTIDKWYAGYYGSVHGREGGYTQGKSNMSPDFDLENFCVLSFEANSRWNRKLEEAQERHKSLGHKVFIFAETVAENFFGVVEIYVDGLSENSWSTSIFANKKIPLEGAADKVKLRAVGGDRSKLKAMKIVRAVDLGSILQVLSELNVPVIMKMDIEGAEFKILPHLLNTNSICGIVQYLFLELHVDILKSGDFPRQLHESLTYLLTLPSCGVVIVLAD